MTRDESSDALELILKGTPTPAQIGAFMIAHRIRRPEPQELAGMIDTYLKLGPKLKQSKELDRPICFGMPLDGRTKTAPIYPLTTLILLDAGQPIVLHGAGPMPTKYGVTAEELFKGLGLSLKSLNMEQVQDGFSKLGFALIHQPDHFPLAEQLISYREEIGKRPPLASMELLWTSHKGEHLFISGYVHPPTESRHVQTLKILEENNFMTVNGLEGSTDLSINRTSKTTRFHNKKESYLEFNPRDYQCNGKDLQWDNIEAWCSESLKALNGEGSLIKSVTWNAGVYLWLGGKAHTILDGIKQAKVSLCSGSAKQTLQDLIKWRKKID